MVIIILNGGTIMTTNNKEQFNWNDYLNNDETIEYIKYINKIFKSNTALGIAEVEEAQGFKIKFDEDGVNINISGDENENAKVIIDENGINISSSKDSTE